MENGNTASSVLPDPTADLHWSDFAGAIQDIFAKNATAHPNRPCVTETPSTTTPQREFTYDQIHRASNQLAFHLLDSGIQRGDVVMIYAYRSVELVVAIMGTLKAGAAFSVVDPAYPADPDNQVKIRGFRVELGDIDTHLSQHPLIQQNVTIIRRDANEEPVLTSYIVPHMDRKLLPYPDDAELAAAAATGKTDRSQFSDTEKYVADAWAVRLQKNANTIDLDDRFFDIGGHSMIGQSILFDVRKQRNISLSMATLFQNPTVREFASVLAAASELEEGAKPDSTPPEMDYHLDGEVLRAKHLPASFPPASHNSYQHFLLTGASGFLGAHILSDILARLHTRVIALVRAKTPEDALQRVKTTCLAYGTWSQSWTSRLECITGDLAQPSLGLSPTTWTHLENTVDVVIHNGAQVHWIHTYSKLKPTNVLATIACLSLCGKGKPKHLTFISSTSVLDTSSHLNHQILESDDLHGSRKVLSTGYAQTKYVSEYLVRSAGARGLHGSIIRPGYITGNFTTGISPTDDFLLRMLKGSLQLNCRPDLSPNTINLVPVSHCARIVVAASLYPPSAEGVGVVQVTPHPQLPFNDFTGALETCGYVAPLVPYAQWKKKLEGYVAEPTSGSSDTSMAREPHALLPLFDWVTDGLPSETISRSLDDTNARAVLRADDPSSELEKESRVTEETVGVYLAFMAAIGFIEPAPVGGKRVEIGEEQKEALK
ncbi:hypothetical protein P7C71_g3043, partial [Lecanoromycetidae sp. Uapishka_2]